MAPRMNQSSLLVSVSLCLFLLSVVLPDSISSSPPCYGRNQSNETISFNFSFYDQFLDEASALHKGGGLKLSCQHRNKDGVQRCQKWFLHFYHNNSKFTRNISEAHLDFNQYRNQREKKVMDEVYNGRYSLGCSCCSVEEEGVGRLHIEGKICDPLKGKVCSTDGVCLKKNGEKTCERNSLLQENGAVYSPTKEEDGYKLCFGSERRGYSEALEYNQFGKNLWPKVKVETEEKCHCIREKKEENVTVDFCNVWKGGLYFRQFLPIKTPQLRLNLRQDTKKIGNGHRIRCGLETLSGDGKVQKENKPEFVGNWEKGWTLDVDKVWNVSRAKIVCKTRKDGNDFHAKWEFLVLPIVAKVRERKDGKGKECVWPGWLKKEPSDLVGDECRDESGKPIQETLSYPPPQAGTVLTFKTLFPEETTSPSEITPTEEDSTERPSRVPRWLRVLPIVFLVVGVVQALPFLLYYGYWECVSWQYRRKLRQKEKARKEKELQEKKAANIRAKRIQQIRDHHKNILLFDMP